jgi:hypothetical protein
MKLVFPAVISADCDANISLIVIAIRAYVRQRLVIPSTPTQGLLLFSTGIPSHLPIIIIKHRPLASI